MDAVHKTGSARDYSRLKALLESEHAFPHDFIVKFIGRNSGPFHQGVAALEAEYPALRMRSRRESAKAAHVALTYVYPAQSAEAVIRILERVATIEDLQVIL
jgi:hypothetical protein